VATQDDETRFMDPIQAPLPSRYEILAELGRGGMGIVYKAHDHETGEVLAVKILKPEIASNTQILDRFKNELRLAHKITHRNVARLYEFNRFGPAAYLTMEFVEGESLRGVLGREGKLEIARGLAIARQLADGLAEAHRQSIVHRDLKPENIMIGPGGEVKVMDFGISRSYAEDVTVTGSVIGTPAYMAPEQAEGRQLDQRTDVYAFGLILYEMFTGSPAFKGDTAVTVALKQIRERPTLPSALAPGLPKHVEAAIMKCLEKDPSARFQSVEEAIAALEGTAAPATVKPGRGGSRKWLAAAMAVLVLAAGAVAVWHLTRPTDSIHFPLEQFTLANGLKIALSPDHASPTFTLAVAYRAGLRRDTPGHAGLAHLVQHATYEGSPNVAPNEYGELISEAGGNANGDTNPDLTMFWVTLPANQLDLALFLESDRMRGLEINQDRLNAARASLLQEQARAMSNGYAAPLFRLTAMSFDNFANQQTTFGPVDELNRATLEEVRTFHKTYYTPSNGVLALVGDFDPAKTRERVEHYFGGVPARPAPTPADIHEPGRTVERRQIASEAGIPAPMLIIAWRVPGPADHDWFALKRLAEVLGGTRTARLNNSLINTAGVATNILVGMDQSTAPTLLNLQVMVAPGKTPGQAEDLVYREIDTIARTGVPKPEMERMQTDALRRRAFSLITTSVRAQVLAQDLAAYGQLDVVSDWERHERSVTSEDVKRVARKYLTEGNRTVLTVVPGVNP
jgi:zinc protease